jgi:hypothetical protein
VEANKVTNVAWRDNDIEERGYDPRMFASGGANTSFVEKEPTPWRQDVGDIICVGPEGALLRVEAKVDREKKYEYNVIRPHLWNRPSAASNSSTRRRWVEYRTAIVLSGSLIDVDDTTRDLARNASVSASSGNLFEYEDARKLAAHPLTKLVYEQLADLRAPNTRPILEVLSQFVAALPKPGATKLPALRFMVLEHSSYLLEWTFTDRRLGFSFEADPKDSGWYYVFSSASSERYESGSMDQLEMPRLIEMALKP